MGCVRGESPTGGLPGSRPEPDQKALDDARALLHEAMRLTMEATDPWTCALAETFWPNVAPAVYRALRADASGRVAQLALARPALLALWLHQELPLGPIVRGVKVRVLVDHLAHASDLDAPSARRLEWWVKPRMLSAWADVLPLPIVAMHPIPPSDAPDPTDDPGFWLALIADATLAAMDGPRPTTASIGAARYISRHGSELNALDDRGGFAETFGEYVLATGHVPDRSASPAKVHREVTRWADTTRHIESWLREVAGLEARGDDALPPGSWPDDVATEVPSRAIVGLRTARELFEETLAMDHCAFGQWAQLKSGEEAIYSVRVGGERSTVCLGRDRHDPRRWVVRQHRGVKNADPSADAEALVAGWVERASPTADGRSTAGATLNNTS